MSGQKAAHPTSSSEATPRMPEEWKERFERAREKTLARGIEIKHLPKLIHKYFSRLSSSSIGKVIKGQRAAREYAQIIEAIASVWAEKEGRAPDDPIVRTYIREIYGHRSKITREAGVNFENKVDPNMIVWQDPIPPSRDRREDFFEDRDLVIVYVTLHAGISTADRRLQSRVREELKGFGIGDRIIRLDDQTFRLETYVKQGTGFAQHTSTLTRDLRGVTGVKDVRIS